MSKISAGTTTTTSLVYTADTSGVLQLQTNGTTTAVTIDTSQNVGVGVTPSAWGSGLKALQINGTVGYLQLANGTGGGYTYWNMYNNGTNNITIATGNIGAYGLNTSGSHVWFNGTGTASTTATLTQAMTLDNSGNLIVGGTLANSNNSTSFGFNVLNGNQFCNHINGTPSGTGYIQFSYNGTAIGSITQNGTTAVAYNTTSDRRLKTNIVDLTNSGTVIDSLKPRSFTWISDNSADAGFIADEFQQVLPRAVTGQPNATKEEEYEVTPAVKDSMGNITTPAVMGTRTVPVYQMIDASQPELIAYLVAEVQSLRARLKAANIA